jgi:leader peptidase (prepilin peptidase)/N-methyltransferase
MSSLDQAATAPTIEVPATPRLGPWARPLTAAAASALAMVAFLVLGADADAALGAFCCAVLVVLSAIDIDRHLLPNRIVLPSAAVALAAHIAIAPGQSLEWTLGAVGASAALGLPLLVAPNGMGLGDVKLALLLGAWLGQAVIPALFLAFVASLPLSLYLLARHGSAARKHAFPFGPFLALGAIVVAFAGGA